MVCFYLLLLMLPYGIVFGYGMGYRAALFVPFFTILCVDAALRKYLLTFAAMLLSIDFLYRYDPITCDSLHPLVNNRKIRSAFFGWFLTH
jgi:hypothetical protein